MTWACPQSEGAPDPAEWGKRNRVQLYPGREQTWVLARATDRDLPSDEELRKMARAVMARWFSETPVVDVGNRSGNADLISVGKPSTSPIVLPTVLQRWTQLPGPLPLPKSGRLMYIPVTFSWRAQSETSRPWPTWRVNWGIGGPCSIDADWMLLDVGSLRAAATPEALPEAPTEESVSAQIEKIGEKVGEALEPSPWLLLLVGALTAGYLINAIKR